MIPFEARVARSIATTAAVLASVLVTSIIAEAVDRERELVDQIQETISRNGPHSAELLEPLVALVGLYEESGDPEFALVTLERALQIVRVNRGLHTLDQVPLVERQIRNEEARGNDAGAWDREQALLKLIRRHPGDLPTAPMLRLIADRQMAALREYLDGEKTPEIVYGCFYKQSLRSDATCTAGSRRNAVQGLLAEAQRNYADAIRVMLDHGLYGSAELRELEMELLSGVDLIRSVYGGPGEQALTMVPATLRAEHYMEPWRGRIEPLLELAGWGLQYSSAGAAGEEDLRRLEMTRSRLMLPYFRGRQSLRRLFAYEAASSEPPHVQAAALAEIADWDLLYSRHELALEGYEGALAMLQTAGASATSIDELFAPAIPWVLPAFGNNPLAPDAERQATGHIDVEFTITKYGRARDVEIREAANATEAAQRRLVDIIDRSRFRPRLTDGGFAETTPVVFRYSVQD